MKPILDACCGGRMFWFDKATPGVVFMDCREVAKNPGGHRAIGPNFEVRPDVVGDFRALPFADATFRLAVFDPPHLTRLTPTSHMGIKYGALDRETWREDIRAGFAECLRVLDPAGFLIFKWAEESIKLTEVLGLAPWPPLFGNRSGKTSHWLTFAAVGEVAA